MRQSPDPQHARPDRIPTRRRRASGLDRRSGGLDDAAQRRAETARVVKALAQGQREHQVVKMAFGQRERRIGLRQRRTPAVHIRDRNGFQQIGESGKAALRDRKNGFFCGSRGAAGPRKWAWAALPAFP
jgi:hypothetical protein